MIPHTPNYKLRTSKIAKAKEILVFNDSAIFDVRILMQGCRGIIPLQKKKT